MSILKNKKGIGLPTVLGISVFVIATIATMLSYAVFQSRLVERSFERSEGYVNAVTSVDAAIKIIIRDNNTDASYLQSLSQYLNVSILPYADQIWTISAVASDSRSVTSYLTSDTEAISTYDDLFQYRGDEVDFFLDPLINPTSLLGAYIPGFLENTFPDFVSQTEFASFQSIIDYIETLTTVPGLYVKVDPTTISNQQNPTVLGHWFVEGNLTIPNNLNLTIPEGYLLIVDGKLTINRNGTIYGNVIVNGDVQLKSTNTSQEGVVGTLYVNGQFKSGKTTDLGSSATPTFILSESDITFGNNVFGYGYFLSDKFIVPTKGTNIDITGGVYTLVSSNLSSADLITNPTLNESLFYDYAIPDIIGPGGSGSGFKFTFPE